MPSISKEDYLKSVYKFQNKNGNYVSTADLDVSNAATSDMAKKLADKIDGLMNEDVNSFT